jgi:hypothetical protein
MRFVAISARQNISGAIPIRGLDLRQGIVVIVGVAEPMFFDIPIERIKISI